MAAVWIPHFSHYAIDRTDVAAPVPERLGQSPAGEALKEISTMSLGPRLEVPDDMLLPTAEQIVAGAIPAPRFLAVPMVLRGYPQDYQYGPPTLQLIMASLELENILLAAYEKTGDARFVDMALRRVLDFAAHEAGQRQDDGFLWNDHAVSARIAVLTRLWRHVRERQDLTDASRATILSLVQRSGRLLAKPAHFTVRTNHGVVQNLALLQIGVAFPALPEVVAWRALAAQRLDLQLPFYVSEEGFVLEHSAEYHYFGTELLGLAQRLMVLNGMQASPQLVTRVRQAREVLGRLMRPDGTLPAFGNTSTGNVKPMPEAGDGSAPMRYLRPPLQAPAPGESLFPLAGYAVWWSATEASLAQTVVAWAKHDGHGHKHADETSVMFWSGGTEWLTNTGYWPYGARNAEAAYAWTGSNAPHRPGEDFAAPRSVRMQGSGATPELKFVDVERRSADGGRFRRQVVQLDAHTLLVLDFASLVGGGTETIWTVDPTIRLTRSDGANRLASSPTPDGRTLSIAYALQSGARTDIRRGSERPFAGWVVKNDQPVPADALHIVDPASDLVSAIAFSVTAAGAPGPAIALAPGATAGAWEVRLVSAGAVRRIARSGMAITVDGGGVAGSAPLSLQVRPLADDAAPLAALKTAYQRAVAAYPPWRDLAFYRWRLTYGVLALALLIEVALLAALRWVPPTRGLLWPMHAGVGVLWLAVCAWMFFIYLP